MKTCCTCKIDKNESEFGNNRSSPDGLQKRCKNCSRLASSQYYLDNKDKARAAVRSWNERNADKAKADRAAWRAANPERLKGYRKKANLKGQYGLTVEQFEELTKNGCCICGTKEDVLHVDHDHSCCPGSRTCGACVRGALCPRCNHGLGNFKDNPDLLESAILYLNTHRTPLTEDVA